MKPPISLRALLGRTGTRTRTVRIAFVRYAWQTPNPTSPTGLPQWNDNTVGEVFDRTNGWSVNEYWRRATLGLVDLKVDLYPWKTMPGSQAALDTNRSSVAALVRQQAAADGVPLARYDQLVSLLHPPPGDRGAVSTPGDVVLDEMMAGGQLAFLEFFEHEFGHLLGFEHAFGPQGGNWVAYPDNFCVMGSTGPGRHAIPSQPKLDVQQTAGAGFWWSGRRLAAASLYRYVEAFKASPSIIRVGRNSVSTVRLVAVTEGRFGDPLIAVVETKQGEATIEYRVATDDDIGLNQTPCLVLHTIGRRPLSPPPPQTHEVNPIVYEGTCAASTGAAVSLRGEVRATVRDVSADGRSVTLEVKAL
jgi:hypothetical protein